MSDQKVSTFLTGGGGFTYEDKVGAFYLSVLLNKGIPEGLDNAEIKKISFQQANQGNPLDDFVIEADSNGNKVELSLQAKRNISFGQNEEFSNVIKACFSKLKSSEFNEKFDKFGIIVGVFNQNIDKHYKNLYSLANSSSDEEEFVSLKDNQHKTVRSFYNDVKQILTKDLKNEKLELWQFFKVFKIIYLDNSEPSKTENQAKSNLNNVLCNIQLANDAYNALLSITSHARINGGSITYETLISKLVNKGIYLKPLKNSKEAKDYEKILDFGKKVLDDIKTDINGNILDRTSLLNEIKDNLEKVDIFAINGNEGSGKSAIFKILAQEYIENSNVLIFSDKRLSDFSEGGWQGFANYKRLETNLNSFLYSLIANGKNTYVFIDGVDFINDELKQRVILDLINEFKEIKKTTGFNYKLILTARTDSSIQWIELNFGTKKVPIEQAATIVSKINVDFEIEDHIDFLDKLNIDKKFYCSAKERFNPLFSNLFILDIFANIQDKEIIKSELDIAELWWGNYIKTPERKTILVELAEKLIDLPNKKHSLTGNVCNLTDLAKSNILIKDEYENYSTRHDIYRDWILAFIFEKNYQEDMGKFIEFLKNLEEINIYYYLKPFELICSKLLLSENFDAWLELYDIELTEINAIWYQGLLNSVLNISTDEEKLFNFLNYIKNKKDILKDILKHLKTTRVYSHKDFNITREIHNLIKYPEWQPFVKWLIINAKDLTIYEEIINIFTYWRYNLVLIGNHYFSEIANIYSDWLSESEDRERGGLISHQKDMQRELIFLSSYAPDNIRNELNKIYPNNREIDVFLSFYEPLVDNFPQEYADFIFKNTTYSIEHLEKKREDWYNSEFDDEEYLIKHSVLRDSHNIAYEVGSFSCFLEKHEDFAIELILKLADTALKGLTYFKRLNENNVITITIDSKEYQFYGDSLVYRWFRPCHMIPSLLNLAFTALENWIRTEVKKGRNFKELFIKLLREDRKNPLTLLGIAISIGTEFYQETKDVLIEIVSTKEIWHYDFGRFGNDMQYSRGRGYYVPDFSALKTQEQKEKEFNNYKENNNRPHRQYNIRDFSTFFLQDSEYKEVFLQNVKDWLNEEDNNFEDDEEKKRIKTFQLQVFQLDYAIKGDEDNALKYRNKIEEINKDDLKETHLPIAYARLDLLIDEGIKKLTNEQLNHIFKQLNETYEECKSFELNISALLQFLTELLVYKHEWLVENNQIAFCKTVIEDIIWKGNNQFEDVYKESINAYLVGVLTTLIYYDFPHHNKDYLKVLLNLLARSAIVRNYFGKESCSKKLWETLTDLPYKKNKDILYFCLLNFSFAIFSKDREFRYKTQNPKETKKLEKLINKTFLNITTLAVLNKVTKFLKVIPQKTTYLKLNVNLDNKKQESVKLYDIILSEDYTFPLKFVSNQIISNKPEYRDKFLKFLLEIIDWNIELSKNHYKESEYSQEYKNWTHTLSEIIFQVKDYYGKAEYDLLINKLIDNKKYIPNLLSDFIIRIFDKKTINSREYVDLLKQIYSEILNRYEKDRRHNQETFIPHIVFLSYGTKMLNDDWKYYQEFIETIDQWVQLYGNDWEYYGTFLSFIKHYHLKYGIKNILNWLDFIINKVSPNYEYLFKRNGDYTAIILKQLKENYPEIIKDAELKTIYSSLVNKLVICNISPAYELQKELI